MPSLLVSPLMLQFLFCLNYTLRFVCIFFTFVWTDATNTLPNLKNSKSCISVDHQQYLQILVLRLPPVKIEP